LDSERRTRARWADKVAIFDLFRSFASGVTRWLINSESVFIVRTDRSGNKATCSQANVATVNKLRVQYSREIAGHAALKLG